MKSQWIAGVWTVWLCVMVVGLAVGQSALAADWYWRGSGASDNIDEVNNWWAGSGNPGSGDNLYFNNSEGTKQPYSNYDTGSWFGNIVVYSGANAITWSGDATYAYKFENNNSPDLFKIQSNIGNRTGNDVQLNPVGSGGLQVTGNVALDGSNWIQIYGDNTLTVDGGISGAGGLNMNSGYSPTVILSGDNTYSAGTLVN
ncbi:MAG: hypothetical protein HN341_17930, partial [Verrucomicrobia bacterium]|nr:hypothetical protein [Verrucomicrobiota bacterium]